MSTRQEHRAKAEELLAQVDVAQSTLDKMMVSPEVAVNIQNGMLISLAQAQAHATLSLAEEEQ